MHYSLSFYQRESQSQSGKASIMYLAYIDGKRIRKSTGVLLPYGAFDNRRELVKPAKGLTKDEALYWNKRLQEIENRARKIFDYHLDNRMVLEPKRFCEARGNPVRTADQKPLYLAPPAGISIPLHLANSYRLNQLPP